MFEGLLKHTGIKVGCCGVTCFMWEGGLEGYNDILAGASRELLCDSLVVAIGSQVEGSFGV